MRTIRIDEDVWRALQRRATPFEDTPNAVLRRALGLDGAKPRQVPGDLIPAGQTGPRASAPSRRLPRGGGRTPEDAFRLPILEALVEIGGAGPVAEVMRIVQEKAKSFLTPVDYDKVPSGYVRWRNNAMWERKKMVDEGLLKSDSPHGYWEITDKGRASLRATAVSSTAAARSGNP
jgi:hypothetical protein